jgi:hypothetical protein
MKTEEDERTFGHVTSCPTLIILASSFRSGSVRRRNQSETVRHITLASALILLFKKAVGKRTGEDAQRDLGQIVTVPSNFCRKTADQFCPPSSGRSSRSRMTCTIVKLHQQPLISKAKARDNKEEERKKDSP